MKKVASKREKWIAAGLGVACVALLANLAVRSNFVRAGAPHPAAPPSTARTVSAPAPHKDPSSAADELAEGVGGRKAFLIDDPQTPEHQDTYGVKEGETFANKYKVLKITPTAVTIEVQDETPHRSVDLEFPQ